jgi:hypothetical protein
VSVTTARPSRSELIRRRQTRYLIAMGIRTVSFVLAVLLPNPWRWPAIAAAVFLPYVAVLFANASDRPQDRGITRASGGGTPALGVGSTRALTERGDRPTVVIDHDDDAPPA